MVWRSVTLSNANTLSSGNASRSGLRGSQAKAPEPVDRDGTTSTNMPRGVRDHAHVGAALVREVQAVGAPAGPIGGHRVAHDQRIGVAGPAGHPQLLLRAGVERVGHTLPVG